MQNLSTRLIEIKTKNKILLNPNLHIKVIVVKSKLALPNSAKIEVKNISPNTFMKLKKQPLIEIFIDGKKIFKGKIINVDNPYEAPEWVCTIYANDIKVAPLLNSKHLSIPKGTTKKSAIESMVSLISDKAVDTKAFNNCNKSSGSLIKQLIVEYKKEEDVIKSLKNMFKGCDAEVVKEDGKVKIQSRNKVPNYESPIFFTRHLKPPSLGNIEINIKIPLDYRAKLGLGFKVESKSVTKNLKSAFLYKQQFNAKVFKITQISHTVDNFSSSIAISDIKGFKIG